MEYQEGAFIVFNTPFERNVACYTVSCCGVMSGKRAMWLERCGWSDVVGANCMLCEATLQCDLVFMYLLGCNAMQCNVMLISILYLNVVHVCMFAWLAGHACMDA